MADARRARELEPPTQHAVPPQIWLGWSAVAVGGLVVLFLAFGSRWPWSQQKRTGGRYVRDRSMGGKEVRLWSCLLQAADTTRHS